MQKMTKAEVKKAMRVNNISMETLRNYCIDVIGKRFTTAHLYRIIDGKRNNAAIEDAIWKLFKPHIEQQRKNPNPQINLDPKYTQHNFATTTNS